MCYDDTLDGDDSGNLDLEALLSDPLVRLVMESDGVTADDLMEAFAVAQAGHPARIAFMLAQMPAAGRA